MPRCDFTPVHNDRNWAARLATEVPPRLPPRKARRSCPTSHRRSSRPVLRRQRHSEASLPSQRYKYRDLLPPTMNPIVPADLPADLTLKSSSADFYEPSPPLKQPSPQRALALGNPIFGYSTHPPPPPVVPMSGSRQTADGERARERMAELQAQLESERALRKKLEAQLASTQR